MPNRPERDLLQPFQNRRVHVRAPASEDDGHGALAEALGAGSRWRPGSAVVANGLIDGLERREDVEEAAVVKLHIRDLAARFGLVAPFRMRRHGCGERREQNDGWRATAQDA